MRRPIIVTVVLLAATTAVFAQMPTPSIQRGQQKNFQPAPNPPPKIDGGFNGPGGTRVTPGSVGSGHGITITKPCGPNIQNGKVVCN
jgi:uncharacterized protein YdeI (BOF family)